MASRLPPLYVGASLADFSEETRNAALDWMWRSTGGLLITGPVGTGKTHLAAAVTRELLEARQDAVFQRFGEFYLRLHDACHNGESECSVLETLQQAGVLVMDDLGAGSLSEHERRFALEIVERRVSGLRPTIITTNWNLKKISELMDDRIASRLGTFAQIGLRGRDQRLEGAR